MSEPKANLSVLIPAGNEEVNIVACVESASFACDVVVVDSLSTDRTVELARPLATRILQREYINSASQKNWAIPQMACEWVFVLDSDERITPELRAEIEAIVSRPWTPDQPAAYRVWRLNHFLGKPVRYCGWQDDKVTRLFRRDISKYQDRHVHADIEVEGTIGSLRHKLLHYTFRSFDQYLVKFDRYTSWAAKDRGKKTKRVTWLHLLGRPAWRFFRQYVMKQGFRDGTTGLVLCILAAYSVFLKYAKLWEMQGKEGASDRVDVS